jgi:hypothetical protein
MAKHRGSSSLMRGAQIAATSMGARTRRAAGASRLRTGASRRVPPVPRIAFTSHVNAAGVLDVLAVKGSVMNNAVNHFARRG